MSIPVTPEALNYSPADPSNYAVNLAEAKDFNAADLPPFLNVPIVGTIGDEATEAAPEPMEPEWEDIARASVRKLVEAPEAFIVEFDADLTSAYAELTGARFSAMKARQEAERFAQVLKAREAELGRSSEFKELKNDKERGAFLAALTVAEREVAALAEAAAQEAAVALEGAKDTVNYVRARLRLYQIGFLAMAAAADLDEGGEG